MWDIDDRFDALRRIAGSQDELSKLADSKIARLQCDIEKHETLIQWLTDELVNTRRRIDGDHATHYALHRRETLKGNGLDPPQAIDKGMSGYGRMRTCERCGKEKTCGSVCTKAVSTFMADHEKWGDGSADRPDFQWTCGDCFKEGLHG